MNSRSPVPSIPISEPIDWEDWLAGRRWRREVGNLVAPESIQRSESSADARLRKLYHGERGLPFTPTKQLPGLPLPSADPASPQPASTG